MVHILCRHLKCQSMEPSTPSLSYLCGSFNGLLAEIAGKTKGYPGLHPCSARKSGGLSSGYPPLPQCCHCHGILEPQLPWPWSLSPSAGSTVYFQPELLWPASASGLLWAWDTFWVACFSAYSSSCWIPCDLP